MAYDEALAERIRDLLAPREALSERKMFGGVAWMLHGNMACGVYGEELLVRLGAEGGEEALAEPHTRRFDMTGRPMRSVICVEPAGIESDEQLAGWVDAGAECALSLPPK